MASLVEFYGEECPHCREMDELVERLEAEEGIEVERLEVWHDEENAQRFRDADEGRCGGVPMLYNEDTDELLCGVASYKQVRELAGLE